jgi:DnaJ domain
VTNLVFLILIGAAIYYGMKFFAGTNPVKVARLLRRVGGYGALAVAALLLLRGRLDVALLAGGVGAWLLGWSAGPDWRMMFSHPSSVFTGHRFIRTARCEVTCSSAGQVLDGRTLVGGVTWSAMDYHALYSLYQLCREEGARYLETYLDSRFAGWRAAGETYADAGAARSRAQGVLTEDEAYEVLGLARGASVEEITAAHRALMKKLHPDHGGTTSLAARVNEAKDVLIRRHR